jgi:serine kinase of HPr protein (carbohydrate metabolism regulator)
MPKNESAGGGETIHASCVLLGEAGILIQGPSGAGKSTLAREIVALARHDGLFARLVADDRVRLEVSHGRLLARSVGAIAGKIELRGLGILETAHEAAAVVRLVIVLSSDTPPRMPALEDGTTTLCGILVPRLSLQSGSASAALALAQLQWQVSRLVTL